MSRARNRYPGDLDDAMVGRSMRWGVLLGIPAIYLLVTTVVLLGGASLGTALSVAALPAIAAGGYFGTLVVVDWAQHNHEVDEVRTILHPIATHHAHQAHRRHAA